MSQCHIDVKDINTTSYDNVKLISFGAIASVAICCLYGGFAAHAGPLWRDEVNSLEFATMPTLSDIWSAMRLRFIPNLAKPRAAALGRDRWDDDRS